MKFLSRSFDPLLQLFSLPVAVQILFRLPGSRDESKIPSVVELSEEFRRQTVAGAPPLTLLNLRPTQ